MGLKYNSKESASLIAAMENNFRISEEAVKGLTEGGNRVVSALNSGSLSGQAYDAANGVFKNALLPTFKETSRALDSGKDDLNKYKEADGCVSHYGVLDEANLKTQITIKKSSKFATDKLLEHYDFVMFLNPALALAEKLFSSSAKLRNFSDSLELQIKELEEQLRALQQFSESTSALFSSSQEAILSTMLGVGMIGGFLVDNGDTILGGVSEMIGSGIQYKNGKVFLDGTKITNEKGVLRWGKKYLYDTTDGKATKNLFKSQDFKGYFKNGNSFEEASGIKLSNYSRIKGKGFNPKKFFNSGWDSIKGTLDDYKGWGDVGKLGKSAKFLGVAGDFYTVTQNAMIFTDGVQEGEVLDFAVDTVVDLGSGVGAAAAGAAVGSLIVPPLGTVVGAAVGIGLDLVINNWTFGTPKQSLIDHTKDGIKNVVKDFSSLSSTAGNVLAKVFW